jgi:CRP-like cAMP-binding protein
MMARSTVVVSPGQNHLLTILPAWEHQWLDPALTRVELELGQLLIAPGAPVEVLYFPLDAVVSLVTLLEDGRTAEAALVGNDGVVGIGVLLEALTSPSEAVCQIPGAALQISVGAFREAAARSAALRYLLLRFAQALLGQMAQSVACNAVHLIEQRCARWLLKAHDRVPGDIFPITHQHLAQVLGVRRATASAAVGALRHAGLIRYHYGQITVKDREGLEQAACECYRAVRSEYERLLGYGSPAVAEALARTPPGRR